MLFCKVYVRNFEYRYFFIWLFFMKYKKNVLFGFKRICDKENCMCFKYLFVYRVVLKYIGLNKF